MKRIIALGLTAVLTAVLIGCGREEKKDSPSRLPAASEKFDKKAPPKTKGSGNPG